MKTNSILKFTCQIVSESDAVFVTDLLTSFTLATSYEKDKNTPVWNIEVLLSEEIKTNIEHWLQLITNTFHIPILNPKMAALENRDWLKENQESFQPLEVGKFYIYGSHITNPTPGQLLSLKIDAATAFGSGNHGSTKGCLLALSKLDQVKYQPSSILDMGCGSGILAMASAKLWSRANVVASDIDPECVKVTKENCALNQTEHVNVLEGNGFQNTSVQRLGPYDLILANILATVLCDIAPSIADSLPQQGITILSGILNTQKDMVISAYQSNNLSVIDIFHVDEWVTLVMKK